MHFKRLGKGGKWICFYLISAVVFAAGTKIIGQIWKNNMWFFSPMYFIQFSILSAFFYHTIKKVQLKRLILILLCCVFVIALLDFTIWAGPFAWNSYALSTETFLLMVYSILAFWQQLRDEELIQNAIFVNTLPDFWYNAGLFIFHCGYLMITLAYSFFQNNHIKQSVGEQRVALSITFIAGLVQLILIFIGLLKAQKSRV